MTVELAHQAAGDGPPLVVLHGLLPHYSAPNRSDRSRHAYAIHAIEAAAEYPADNWLQRSGEMPLRGFG